MRSLSVRSVAWCRPLTAPALAFMLAFILGALGAPAVRAQGLKAPNGATTADTQVVGRAVRAATPPVLDGKENDAVWRQAPAMTDFRQFDPGENLPPTFRTEAKVAYDDRNMA